MTIFEQLDLLADRLVMALDFEDNAGLLIQDKSLHGNENNGSLENGTLLELDQETNSYVANFDGDDDYIKIANSNDINTQTHHQRTISVQFKIDDINSGDRKQVIYEEGGQGCGLNIYVFEGRLYVGIWNTQIWQGTYLSTNQIEADKWHHVTVVLDGESGVNTLQADAFRGYLDGDLFGQGEALELPAHWGGIGVGNVYDKTKFHDGGVSTTGNQGFQGHIDNLLLYNQALNNDEDTSHIEIFDHPLAIDDQLETVTNLPLQINPQTLFNNDDFGNSLQVSISEVSNNINGTVVFQDGEIWFTPQSNFEGIASFEYTVQTEGGLDTAKVEIEIKSASLGTNLATVADWSTQIPFVDGFRSSRAWIPQKFGVWNTEEPLDLDENGWVRSLPSEEDNTEYEYVSTLLYREIQGQYLGGTYIVSYDGDGLLEYGMDATKNEALSTEGRDVIEVNPSHKGILITLKATDRENNGDYLRNIRVIPQQFEDTYQSDLFNPAFIEKIDPFSTIRFMDWMETNNSSQKEWQNRPTLNTSSWSKTGVPVEVMVELANQTDSNPWFTIPHQATDEYIREFAQYVQTNLEPGLKVYVEYSNEVWNPQFDQYHWISQQYGHVQDGYSQRLTEVIGIWDKVFSNNPEVVIGVASGQAANSWILGRILQFAWDDNPLSPQEYGIDAIAIAPYFGGATHLLNTAEKVETIKGWIEQEPDGGVTKLFDELTNGGLTGQSALEFVADLIMPHQEIAAQYGLDLLAYEGGQHLVSSNDAELTELFIKANRDPRMGELYEQYLSQWYQLGGDAFVNFNDISSPSKWGSWGALESVYDPGSPKYDALLNVINNFTN
jgi:hypothetical protein